jgi:hypothetical protein
MKKFRPIFTSSTMCYNAFLTRLRLLWDFSFIFYDDVPDLVETVPPFLRILIKIKGFFVLKEGNKINLIPTSNKKFESSLVLTAGVTTKTAIFENSIRAPYIFGDTYHVKEIIILKNKNFPT